MAFRQNRRATESDLRAAEADLERFRKEFQSQVGASVRDAAGQVREFERLHADDLRELAERIEDLIDQLQAMVGELRERGDDRTLSSDEAAHLVATVNTLAAEVDALLETLDRVRNELAVRAQAGGAMAATASVTLTRAAHVIRAIIRPVIRQIALRLWRLISGLLTPKEWKIAGELGNKVWGLGSATLEITFGP